MFRLTSRLVLWFGICSWGANGPIVQEKEPAQIKDWGDVVDPQSDCKVVEEKGRLTITVPGTYHDLNPTPRFNNLTAPRVLRDIEGDFTVQVKVVPHARPTANTSTKIHSFVAAGLLVWHDDKNFIRFLRAANGETGILFASAELYKDAKLAGDRGALIEDKELFLRVQRLQGKFALSASYDAENWSLIPIPPIELPQKLKVGVMAINTTTKVFAPQFEAFNVSATATAIADAYTEYGEYDLRDALKTRKSDDGKEEHSFDMKLVALVLEDLAKHARNYPPAFRSEAEKNRATRDAKLLMSMFETLVTKEDVETGVLLHAALVSSISHNLDIQGSAQKATGHFERILQREPDHAAANYHYGAFLAGTANGQKRSVPYLERAVELGVEDARFSLGVAYLMMGDTAKSLEQLEAYAKRSPKDVNAQRLIEAIKAGRVKVERKDP